MFHQVYMLMNQRNNPCLNLLASAEKLTPTLLTLIHIVPGRKMRRVLLRRLSKDLSERCFGVDIENACGIIASNLRPWTPPILPMLSMSYRDRCQEPSWLGKLLISAICLNANGLRRMSSRGQPMRFPPLHQSFVTTLLAPISCCPAG